MRLVETDPLLFTMLLFRTWTAAPGELIRAFNPKVEPTLFIPQLQGG